MFLVFTYFFTATKFYAADFTSFLLMFWRFSADFVHESRLVVLLAVFDILWSEFGPTRRSPEPTLNINDEMLSVAIWYF